MLNKKPMILVFAGPNGSGKSTITQYFDKVGTYTNADEIVAATGMSNEEAAVFADKKRYEAIEAKEDFTFETVLSSHYKLDILRKAKESGYFIKCIFVLTNDPMINVSRVETRVASGGHNVDKDKIISRYYKSLANIKQIIELCDILHVYDNTSEPVRIIRKHKADFSIFPNDQWPVERIVNLIS
ncbi:zeta toxin family protein [uncultured Ruminococcus sp.]|jgi:predicted ABC-type ATPase|uniref:zeta toxin family protein n=1 Tax=uncultured Ruminococcus sp. TaxID=165186 RepID=UPI0025EE3B21|nr:zeta toxin family protein [uncultured Ruminococcus sp.]